MLSNRAQSLFGMKVIIAPQHPKYALPQEVIPGVPWPAGFRDEINSWSKQFLGTWCTLKRGEVFVMGNTFQVHPADYEKLKHETLRGNSY